jgi:hypothetical protein
MSSNLRKKPYLVKIWRAEVALRMRKMMTGLITMTNTRTRMAYT